MRYATFNIYLVFIFQITLAMNANAQSQYSVRVGSVAENASFPIRSAPATAMSVNEPEVAAEISSRIEKIHVKVGDIATQGSLLAKLDCRSFQQRANVRRSQLAVRDKRIELAQRRLSRTRQLAQQQSVSDEILDERQSELDILQAERAEVAAEYALAKLEVDHCAVRAPFQALVIERLAADGEYVRQGDAIVKVVDIEHVEVSAQIQFGDVDGIEASEQLWFEHADKKYPVTVRAALGALNTATRTREMRLEFSGEPALPGAGGQLFWRDQRPHVSGNLLVRRDEKLGLFILQAGQAKFIALPDAAPGRAAPVDLSPDTKLILEGFYNLSDGDPVTVE